MDEVNAQIRTQGSICSDTNGEETCKIDVSQITDRRICLVGRLGNDSTIRPVAESYCVPVVTSENGREYVQDDSLSTFFVLEKFEGDIYNGLYKAKQSILGPPALQQLARKDVRELPDNTRPLFNIAMRGVVVCFTGFRNKDDLTNLVPLIHHMGGSIRKDISSKVTHLIANTIGGDKYQYAATFKVPVMNLQWVYASWERRYDLDFSSLQDSFVAEYKLKPFHGARVCFVGFPEDEEKHMTEVLLQNGGTLTTSDDTTCSHLVMDHSEVIKLEASSAAPLSPKLQPPPSPNLRYILTPNSSIANIPESFQGFSALDTLHERSHDDDLASEIESCCFDQSFDVSNMSFKRKRKIASPEHGLTAKRKRDKSYYSERKSKISEFFKTPINYFANRRRTIDGASFNESLNESVVSSSGVFNVETVSNLNCETPKTNQKKSKKNLFTRTFSSSKFTRSKSKHLQLNASKLSFSDVSVIDGAEKLNASCFPDISMLPACSAEAGSRLTTTVGSSGQAASTVVVDDTSIAERGEPPPRGTPITKVVKTEWFWTSVQKEVSQDEREYLFDDFPDRDHVLTPTARRDSQPPGSSRRKRKRLQETIQALATASPATHKRRSSAGEAGLLSVSGSFLDCTASPEPGGPAGVLLAETEATAVDTSRKVLSARQQVFLELLQTETNYVSILNTIILMFKKHLEDMPDEDALLNNTELNLIFGKLPAIYETHVKMLRDLTEINVKWAETASVGNVIIKYSTDLLKAYPPFINYFEEMKEVLMQCDQNKPRFHAFLKACQTRPECGRQSLQELMIRPVQRLGSISLLLNDILKNTPKTNPDHAALDQALAALREVMTHINEDKRKAEGQVTLFNIFNDIDNCPPDIVSSHRSFIGKTEVVQLSSSEGLSNKGNSLVLFLFSDQLEVCKKKSKVFNNLKSPTATMPSTGMKVERTSSKSLTKPYKHIRLMALNTIKRVIDIKETEDCQKVFSLVCRSTDENKERLYSFAMAEDNADKVSFLKTLTRQMANNACTADADKFMAYLEPHQLDIDTSDMSNGTFSKAFKFATRTKLKVGRAFSFNKTPSKLKRAVSSMMSPFGSSTNLTPASQLAQMRLASYSNINELGTADNDSDESPPIAPMSVQPTRKHGKSSSLGVNALKRL